MITLNEYQKLAGRKIWLAMDGMDNKRAIELIEMFAPFSVVYKLGHERIHAPGGMENVIAACKANNGRIFIDAKLYDIPETVKKAAANISAKGADYFNVAAEMTFPGIKAAVDNKGPAKVLAVTLLTSISDDECRRRYNMSAKDRVIVLAKEATSAGVDGLICSALEVEELNRHPELKGLIKITPGIRSAGKDVGDQKRVVTPADAYKIGVEGMVIGRQVMADPNPCEALLAVINEVAEAMEVVK